VLSPKKLKLDHQTVFSCERVWSGHDTREGGVTLSATHKGRGSDPIYYTQGRGGRTVLRKRGTDWCCLLNSGGGDNLQMSHLRVAITTLRLEFSSPGVSLLLETPSLSPYLVREVTSIKCKNSDTTSSTDM